VQQAMRAPWITLLMIQWVFQDDYFVNDYERLVGSSAAATSSLPTILKECVAHDSDPATSCFYFSQHLDRMRLPRQLSPVVSDAFDVAMERLTAALGG
jgi:hypothetical protein